MRYGEI
jgi:hypothetical protein